MALNSHLESTLSVLREQNPWHVDSKVPEEFAPPKERILARWLWQSLKDRWLRRFQLIMGPRRVGKSTVLYQTVRNLLQNGVGPSRIWWIRIDHPEIITKSLGDLVRAVVEESKATSENPVYLMLDELVFAKDWDLWLKTFYDERWPVQVAATSSSAAALKHRRFESGIGRWSEQQLGPCLFSELLTLADYPYYVEIRDSLAETLADMPGEYTEAGQLEVLREQFMMIGGFPELSIPLRRYISTLRPDHFGSFTEQSKLGVSHRVLRSDVVDRAIYKDIPQSYGVRNPRMLERLLYILAGQVTGMISPANICEDLDNLTQPTFDRYLSYLEQTYLVFTLTNYSNKESGVQKRGRKGYLVEGVIRNAVLRRGMRTGYRSGEGGVLLENQAATALHTLSLQSGVRLHYWRDGKKEVDFVYDHPERPLAFEIKSSPQHRHAGLAAFMERYPKFRGGCYIVAPNAPVVHAKNSRIGTLPVARFLLAVGAQAELFQAENLGIFN